MKPKTIIWFDWLFWTSLALGLVSLAVSWPTLAADLEGDPDLQTIGIGAIIIFVALGNGISILLWFFISQKASNVARWIYSVLAGFGVLAAFVNWDIMSMLEIVLGLILAAMSLATIIVLFLPPSNAWFRNRGVGGPEDIKAFE